MCRQLSLKRPGVRFPTTSWPVVCCPRRSGCSKPVVRTTTSPPSLPPRPRTSTTTRRWSSCGRSSAHYLGTLYSETHLGRHHAHVVFDPLHATDVLGRDSIGIPDHVAVD